MGRSNINARLTGYWPFQSGLSASERLMEGGPKDRIGRPLYTLEAYQRGEAPFVSVSADWTIFPYGQLIEIDVWPGIPFRIVDTGSHFTGLKKVYREAGREPFDICVDSSETKVPTRAVVTVIEGDAEGGYKGPSSVQWAKVEGQTPTDDSLEDAIAETIDAIVEGDPTTLSVVAIGLGVVLYWALS